MSPISKAISELTYRIPMPILREIFSTKNYSWRDTPISIDEQITNLVIKSRVMVDCNLVGGTHALIPLDNLRVEQVDPYSNVYRIPKSLTQGRSIVSVLSVGYGTTSLQGLMGGLGSIRPGSVSAGAQAGQAMMDAMSPIPVSSTAKVQLIAENTIMVRDTNTLISNGYLRCILANDNELSHIQLRSILAFCKLVELAVKSYIYNEYIIQMDRAYLSGGQDLGRFKEIVDGYADSEEMYQTYLREKWAKVSFMNDTETYTRFLKMQIGSHR